MYFFDEIKKTIVALGPQFTDITIVRKGRNVEKTKSVLVELVYGNKAKWYKKFNRLSEKVHTVLPVMSLYWDGSFNHDTENQRNKFKGIGRYSPEHQDIINKINNPKPVILTLVLYVRTATYSDLRQILTLIETKFKPDKVMPINLIPEIGITANVNYELDDTKVTIETATDEESEDKYEIEFAFSAYTFLFEPITDRHVLMKIKMAGEDMNIEAGSELAPNDVINTKYLRSYISPKTVLEKMTVTTELSKIYRIELAGVYQDEIKIIDRKGNTLPFVFEYDNGECYGSDIVCPVESANKTNVVYVKDIYDSFPDKDTQEFTVITKDSGAYNSESASDVLFAYDDFSVQTLSRSSLQRTDERDTVYIENGALFMKSFNTTISTIAKVYSRWSNSEWKYMAFKLSSLDRDEDDNNKFVGGLAGNNFFVALMTGDEDEYKLVEINVITGTQTVLKTGLLESVTDVVFTRDGNAITCTIDGTVFWTGSLSSSVNRLWIGSNFNSLVGYEYYKGY